MRDWIGFSKDAGSDVLAKTGQWNTAVAIRALVDAYEQHVENLERAANRLPPIAVGGRYAVVLKCGKEVEGLLEQTGTTWIELRDAKAKVVAVRLNEVACFSELTK